MIKDRDTYLGTPSRAETRYQAAADRYETMQYRRCGKSGLRLPLLSLGLWQNFGGEAPFVEARRMALRAFDLGITHFDLGNNYGRPAGSAEATLGKILSGDLASYRREILVSTKAGYDMWPGPYGEWGSRKYLIASVDDSLQRLGLDYVDIFYSHRFDPETPLDETVGALADIVRQGKALYVGISSYGVEQTRDVAALMASHRVPFVVHQPSYSLFNRWIEQGLLGELDELGLGCVTFTALEQGLLTDKYIPGVSGDGRMSDPASLLKPDVLDPKMRTRLAALDGIAHDRGQSLAQMAIAWVLRDRRVTSTVIGARCAEQIEENVAALDNLSFTDDECAEIDRHSGDLGITLWPPNC